MFHYILGNDTTIKFYLKPLKFCIYFQNEVLNIIIIWITNIITK